MKFHSYSEIFPLIEGAALDELTEDIKANGLREKIWTYKGQVLDGRNRFIACDRAGVKPEYRKYEGDDPLSFVISLNVQRRHLTESQRAMAAARIATLRYGDNQHTAMAVPSQAKAAESVGVSTDSLQRARKVIDSGSKQLQRAVDSGEVSVRKASSVVALPKSQQLAAAKAKAHSAVDPGDPERPDDIDEEAALVLAEKDMHERYEKAMAADDRVAEAFAQIKQQSKLLATVMLTRDGYMRGKDEITSLLRKEQNKVAKLERENKKLRDELEGLRERIAIMDVA